MTSPASIANLVVEQTEPGVLVARLSGNWSEPTIPDSNAIRRALNADPPAKALEFDTAALSGWDSRLVALVGHSVEMARGYNMEVWCQGLPEGVRQLLRLADLLPEKTDARRF